MTAQPSDLDTLLSDVRKAMSKCGPIDDDKLVELVGYARITVSKCYADDRDKLNELLNYAQKQLSACEQADSDKAKQADSDKTKQDADKAKQDDHDKSKQADREKLRQLLEYAQTTLSECDTEWSLLIRASGGASTHFGDGTYGQLDGTIGARYKWMHAGMFVTGLRFTPKIPDEKTPEKMSGLGMGVEIAGLPKVFPRWTDGMLRTGAIFRVGIAGVENRDNSIIYDGYMFDLRGTIAVSNRAIAYRPSWQVGVFLGPSLIALTSKTSSARTISSMTTQWFLVYGLVLEVSYAVPKLLSMKSER